MKFSRSQLAEFEQLFHSGDYHRMLSIRNGSSEHDRAIPIILFRDHKFQLDRDALEEILLQPEVKERAIVVLSVAGAFRKGKSFILNFFLRYMYHSYSGEASDMGDNWMGREDDSLVGFSWKGGSERDTTGILMWSKVFLTTLPNGEKVAVILMDTQGTFDSGSTVRECATVFALSTLISSIQIYNLSQNIQEDDLQHLQLFSDYGKLAMADSGKIPFQRLLFLVRDWFYPYEAEFGDKGGQEFLQKRLKVSAVQVPELQSTRRRIKSCFSDIGCFLMPYPGNRVTTSPTFDGRLSDIDDNFKLCLNKLVAMLLSKEKLLVKEICGQQVRAKELVQYFNSYVALFSGDDLPEPKSVLTATAEANNLAAIAASKETYSTLMEECCGAATSHLTSSALTAEHQRIKVEAINEFITKRKMGGDEFSESYRVGLETDLDQMFEQYKRYNQLKNSPSHSPQVLIGLSAVFYFVSSLLNLTAFYSLASMCTIAMYLTLVTLATWAYAKWSGEMEEFASNVDSISYFIWENVLKPTYVTVLRQTIRQLVASRIPNVPAD